MNQAKNAEFIQNNKRGWELDSKEPGENSNNAFPSS